MPLVRLETNVTIADEAKKTITSSLLKLVADGFGKPEKYVMVIISHADVVLGSKQGPCAYVSIRGIGGFNSAVNNEMAQKLCGLLKDKLKIPEDAVYITYEDVPAVNWAYNGSTFG